jgi:membrane fusion protein, multidrug efflux system
VKMGPKFGSLWVVEEGLKAGDQVILEGLTKVEPDMVVVPKPAKEPTGKVPAAGAGG